MLTYNMLRERPREFLAATGLTTTEFEQLLPAFTAAYAQCYPPQLTAAGQPRNRRAGGGSKALLANDKAKLLFILIYLKTNPLQIMHGLQFDLSQAQTNYWIHHLLPVVQQALLDLGYTPERDPSQVAATPLLHDDTPDLVIDGTERRRQRPKDQERQKEHYSSKKKTHTDKNILLVQQTTGQVIYLGATLPGKTHDKKAADAAEITYPANTTLDQDSGFQGYAPAGVLTRGPKKSRARAS